MIKKMKKETRKEKKTLAMMFLIIFGWPFLFKTMVNAGLSAALASAIASLFFIFFHALSVEAEMWEERKKRKMI